MRKLRWKREAYGYLSQSIFEAKRARQRANSAVKTGIRVQGNEI